MRTGFFIYKMSCIQDSGDAFLLWRLVRCFFHINVLMAVAIAVRITQ